MYELKFSPVMSKTKPILYSEASDLPIDEINQYNYIVLYYTDGVVMAAAPITAIRSNLLEIRAFCKEKEFYCIRTEDGFRGRVRTDDDGDGEKLEYFDALHKVWGTSSRSNKCTLTEDRGTVVKIPFDLDPNHYLFINVRNYFTSQGELQTLDWRFVDFSEYDSKSLVEVGQR